MPVASAWLIVVALAAYSLCFSVVASTTPALQRPDWRAWARLLGPSLAAPAAIVTWTLGQASLRDYLGTGPFQVVQSDGYPWYVHEIDFVSIGQAQPPPRAAARAPVPTRREWLGGAICGCVATSCRALDLARLRLGEARRSNLGFGSNGVLIDGIGPGW